jgi:hypothetical protein
MEGPPTAADRRRAIVARDRAAKRLRRMTRVTAGGTLALGGIFAALAAGSTHVKKTLAPTRASETTTPAAVRYAPAPPLVQARSDGATPAPPTAAPAPASTPPVVVSGGS